MGKKQYFIFAVLLALVLSIGKSAQAAEKKPYILQEQVTIMRGESVQLQLKNATGKVVWSSNNKRVKVDQNGKVTADKKETAVAQITAKVGKHKLKCLVIVEYSKHKYKEVYRNEKEVKVLKKLLKVQKQRGVDTYEFEYLNSPYYKWNENGHLIEIDWEDFWNHGAALKLRGNISLAGFPNLKTLRCSDAELTGLDVSENLKLEKISCSNNKIKELNLGNNKNLKDLDCGRNKLVNLDVRKCKSLVYLSCDSNQLKKIDVGHNQKLEGLSCSKNKLTKIDVNNNQKLEVLSCSKNKLTQIDVSNNEKLQRLYCEKNKIKNLDISKNKELIYLSCNSNQLKSLDVTQNAELSNLDCQNNKLKHLNVNGLGNLLSLNCRNNEIEEIDVSECVRLKEFKFDPGVSVTGL